MQKRRPGGPHGRAAAADKGRAAAKKEQMPLFLRLPFAENAPPSAAEKGMTLMLKKESHAEELVRRSRRHRRQIFGFFLCLNLIFIVEYKHSKAQKHYCKNNNCKCS